MTFLNILPDPANPIKNSGVAGTGIGVDAHGFASVSLTSESPIMRSRTNSGRLITRGIAGHKWKIKISYNPMTRDEFDPVYSFLLQKRGGLIPFYVSLPQYQNPKQSAFSSFYDNNTIDIDSSGGYVAGTAALLCDGLTYSSTNVTGGHPVPGDLFTITDTTDSNHTKAYMVVRSEVYNDNSASVSNNHVRIHINPPLVRTVPDNTALKFDNPLIKVVLSTDIQEYNLNTNNLYKFSLNLEETQ